jgi:hypothetical protein
LKTPDTPEKPTDSQAKAPEDKSTQVWTPKVLPPVRIFSAPFPRPFFLATFVAYVAGLVTTMSVMHIFQAAQPALLYLVPFCLIASLLTGLVTGELSTLWAFSDAKPEKDEKAAN